MIKLQVIGNLGKDCVTNTVNGKNVINFNVAHTEKFKDAQGNQKDKTIWVDCAYWTDRTGIAPYLKKGTQVYVEGSPEVRTYAKNDGTTGASLTLRVGSVQLLGKQNQAVVITLVSAVAQMKLQRNLLRQLRAVFLQQVMLLNRLMIYLSDVIIFLFKKSRQTAGFFYCIVQTGVIKKMHFIKRFNNYLSQIIKLPETEFII